MNYGKKNGFTLIEIMVGILIVGIVLIGGFQALISISIGKTRLMADTDIQKESFYFIEKFFEMVKKGGTIDYEEYFNRKVIGNTTTLSGHYDIKTGFGNFGSGGIVGTDTFGDLYYYCRSGNGTQMSGTGCYASNLNNYNDNVLGKQQRYGEYSFQFIDYNSNYNDDLGDENGNGNIIGDDDDEYLGVGPDTFSGGVNIKELYLISGNKKERTFFRWSVSKDPFAPDTSTCNVNNTVSGSGCLGTIEYIKLIGKDRGMDHDFSLADDTQYDGVIDTWIIDPNFTGGEEYVAGTGSINWVKLFPETINVSEFKVLAFPNNDIEHNWKNDNEGENVSPYVILKMQIKPSWLARRKLKSNGKVLDFSMTINLSNIYSN